MASLNSPLDKASTLAKGNTETIGESARLDSPKDQTINLLDEPKSKDFGSRKLGILITRLKTEAIEEVIHPDTKWQRFKKVFWVFSKFALFIGFYVIAFPLLMVFAGYNYDNKNVRNFVNFGTLGFYLGAG